MTYVCNSLQSTFETLAACCTSKLAAALLTYPCQNVRACQQAVTGPNGAAANVTAATILRQRGLRGLYAGLTPYLMHVVPNVCLVFLVYEAVVQT